MLKTPDTHLMEDFLPHFQAVQQQMAWRLGTLVEIETPTSEKTSVDLLGNEMMNWAKQHGAVVERHPQSLVGDFITCRWNHHLAGKPILLLAHLDTVHPLGSVDKRPTLIDGDRLYGVGAYDMKGGIAVVQTVIEFLYESGLMPQRPLTVLFNTDEEIGSHYSRRLVEKLAADASLALVLEFCNYAEDIVVARKGVGIFQITALGKEAHSGGNPDEGINAIVEMSHHITQVCSLADIATGTLVTPTVIRGGSRHNVIPGECELVINVRVPTRQEAARIDAGLVAITDSPTLVSGSELILTGDFVRPPMEFDAVAKTTLASIQDITGTFLGSEARGEGSDANFSAALGIPTLCGLGPSGEGAHAEHEQVYLPSMPRRAALLASILCNWR